MKKNKTNKEWENLKKNKAETEKLHVEMKDLEKEVDTDFNYIVSHSLSTAANIAIFSILYMNFEDTISGLSLAAAVLTAGMAVCSAIKYKADVNARKRKGHEYITSRCNDIFTEHNLRLKNKQREF